MAWPLVRPAKPFLKGQYKVFFPLTSPSEYRLVSSHNVVTRDIKTASEAQSTTETYSQQFTGVSYVLFCV